MSREVSWTPWDGTGMEHLRLTVDGEGVIADGLAVGVADDRAYRRAYRVRCDAEWRVREVRVSLLEPEPRGLHLLADGAGHWTTGAGEPLPALDGCVDVDLSATPFTNTLPIRRLKWRPGTAAELAVAYIAVADLRVTVAHQRYTCLRELGPAGGRFRYESLSTGFTVELEVDEDGLVLDYPGLSRRVWSA